MGRLRYFAILILVVCSDTWCSSIKKDFIEVSIPSITKNTFITERYDFKKDLTSNYNVTLTRAKRQANPTGQCSVRRCNQVRSI